MRLMPRQVVVTAPSRLHLGLYALAGAAGSMARSYGGVGLMVSQPGLIVRFHEADRFNVSGMLAERAARFASRWAEFYSQLLRNVKIEIVAAPPDHVGLGTGTQLALAVSAGLTALQGLPVPGPEELARSVGRGLRSAVGAYGFSLGGLIAERGKLPDEFLSPLDCRIALPETWRFVLVRPETGSGLAGNDEQQAMDAVQRDLDPLSQQLIEEARTILLPAAATGDFATFAESLGRYCELAGRFYVDVQGGPFNGPVVTALAERIRALGHRGLGQSSWGPTLFVACEDEAAAQQLVTQLSASATEPLVAIITPVANEPASVQLIEN
jgi:beta-ribofuranosylaminobenzene 5'-phosphate synthase